MLPYIYGLLFTFICTSIAKVSTGRLRPYFHSICKPNVSCGPENLRYIETFQCSGFESSPKDAVEEIGMSFMSGY
jgi:hypothetical protein